MNRTSENPSLRWLDDRVHRAKIHWEDAVDNLHQLVCVLDLSGGVIRVNRAVERWSLGTVKSAPGKSLHDLLHPSCTDPDCGLTTVWGHAWDEVRDVGLARFEVEDKPAGRELDVTLVRNKKDLEGGPDFGYCFAIVEDVTERRDAEQTLQNFNQELHRRVREQTQQLREVNRKLQAKIAEHLTDKKRLREAQDKYSSFVENTLTGIYLLKDGRIQFVNGRLASMFGYQPAELENRKLSDVLQLSEEPPAESVRDAAAQMDASEQVVRGVMKDGRRIWLKISGARLPSRGEVVTIGNVVDVTRQIEAERVLVQSQQELEDLSAQLIKAEEEERQRIAAELHDGIGQQLSVIKFGVESVRNGLKGSISREQEDLLGGLIERVRQATEEVRRISMDLRPSILDDLGIVITIDWFCREYQKMLPRIAIHRRIEIDENDIPPALKVAIFRILQEACNNISKYAKAGLISIKLVLDGDRICFSVADDGIGFDYAAILAGTDRGFGLGSMKERAKLTGGVYELRSAPGEGTRIDVEWLLTRPDSGGD